MSRKYITNKFLFFTPIDTGTYKNESPKGSHFSQQTIDGLIKLGYSLRQIHNRLISEGYSIIDGQLIAPDGSIKYESTTNKRE